ncbi:hypothetical protein OPV22_025544 [Ensete ventricosum]|uniref:RING-CH-type domain-containing protein n=1 Tax=Ensete ventricosum TaxID=4639 RepID=A0AAV8Q7P7_ENSVE|nr:hypothetical protein OPV22_025544 [Ensete ventricosum]
MGIDWSLLYNCGLRIFCLAWMAVEMLRGFLWFVLVFYALARVLANMEGMERPSSDCSAGRRQAREANERDFLGLAPLGFVDPFIPMTDPACSSPLIGPVAFPDPNEIDLEAGPSEQFQCRICLETDGRDFIAPCKCKGTSKFVHRECLDHWRAVKEGFAFSHCTTCKTPYYLLVQSPADRKWRILKFRFFVTRDILFIFAVVQLIISSLAYLVYLVDSSQNYWLRLACGFGGEISFYYICGAVLFFALLGLSGCFITCYDQQLRDDLAQPCREFCLCCCRPGMCLDYDVPGSGGTLCIWADCTTCCESTGGDCSVLVATVVGQRIWQRHYHILAKRMLTKEYVVEDVDSEDTDWCPPPLPADHVQQLKALGLLIPGPVQP